MAEPLFVEPEGGVVAIVLGIEGEEDAYLPVVAPEGGLDYGKFFFAQLIAFFDPTTGGISNGFEVLRVVATTCYEFVVVREVGDFEGCFGEGEQV